MRRIVQISVTGIANNCTTQANSITFALCDDGTVWAIDDTHPEWRPLPPIPQEVLPDAALGSRP